MTTGMINETVLYHNIWANAFKSVELAFKDDDIRNNLKEVIKLQIEASPFEDIQIYKFNKKNNLPISNMILDDKKPILGSDSYNYYGENEKNIQSIDENGRLHYLNIS